MNQLEVSVDGGKYTVVQDGRGVLFALRNGEPWRDLVGDKLVLCLAYELEQARKEHDRDTDLLRQCLHTGDLRTGRTRELYLKVRERVGEKP